ncbi:MAG TPA: nucleotidyltransferase domain-containing protein [Dehalococcoidia bacterium]|nr:nucleotidyltransferase domain-containing protein [Dehalococcoidia bacterium]
MEARPDFQGMAQRFDSKGVSAIALVGSHARGDAGPYSDVDIIRFVSNAGSRYNSVDGTYILDSHLVVVKTVLPKEIDDWFAKPQLAIAVIPGLRSAIPLVDRHGFLTALQERARLFVWDEAMQQRASAWASKQMVGWIEEVHKGLEGLNQNDIGRLLNARFGLSWGLSRVMQVQRGVLLSGDNAFFDAVAASVGDASVWTQLRRTVFGIQAEGKERPVPLGDQVIAGLRLYVETAALLGDAISAHDQPLIDSTVALINSVLS